MIDFRKYEAALEDWFRQQRGAWFERVPGTGDLLATFEGGFDDDEDISLNLTELAKHLADEVTA